MHDGTERIGVISRYAARLWDERVFTACGAASTTADQKIHAYVMGTGNLCIRASGNARVARWFVEDALNELGATFDIDWFPVNGTN